MALKSYPYSSTVISFRQNALLTKETIIAAANSETAEAAMLFLIEKGYAKGSPEMENPYAFEHIIAYELESAMKTLKNIAPDETLLSLFLLKYDYLNLKTLLKLDLLGKEFSEKDITPYGSLSFDCLKNSIAERNYNRLPEEMSMALKAMDKMFAVQEDASLIGMMLDKAYSRQVNRMLMREKNPLIHDYFNVYFDFTNIMALLRLRSSRMEADMLNKVLLEGGRLRRTDLYKAFEDNSGMVFSEFYHFGYEKYLKEPLEKLTGNARLFALEKARDDYLLALLKKDRYNMFTSSRAVAYLIAKEREAAAVRLLMVSMLNKIGAEEMSTRLKTLYV